MFLWDWLSKEIFQQKLGLKNHMRTREEHLEYCKEISLEYLKVNDVRGAITGMLSEMEKNPETEVRSGSLKMLGLKCILENDVNAAKKFIEGFR